MKGDFSKKSFDKTKNYSSVRMQQGRVQLDSDWNEQMDIWSHRTQTESVDFIGGSGTPDGNDGFSINVATDDGEVTLQISQGRYYVDGILCENQEDIFFTSQPDWPNAGLPEENACYLAYLDVWQKGVSFVEDFDLLETALNGADTTTRTKNIAQVKLLQLDTTNFSEFTCESLFDINNVSGQTNQQNWENLTLPNKGRLRAQIGDSANFSNQLYRIEIHQSGNFNTATFKWSRDNGSVVAKITEITSDSIEIEINSLVEFSSGDWLELTSNARELNGETGYFVRIGQVQSNRLTEIQWPSELDLNDTELLNSLTIARKWDTADNEIAFQASNFVTVQQINRNNNTLEVTINPQDIPANLTVGQAVQLSNDTLIAQNQNGYFTLIHDLSQVDNNIIVLEDLSLLDQTELESLNKINFLPASVQPISAGFIALERGLEIQFEENQNYQTGDYWLIPTRANENTLQWEQDTDGPIFKLPDGIQHHYTKLAIVEKQDGSWFLHDDCRQIFSPITSFKHLDAVVAESNAPKDVIHIDSEGDVQIQNNLTVGDTVKAKTLAGVNGLLSTNRWQEHKLLVADEIAADNYGNSVAISGDRVVVGVFEADPEGVTNAGCAYVFRWNGSTWIEEQKLTASDGKGNDRFGVAVAIDEDLIVVGAIHEAPNEDAEEGDNFTRAGSAYVFRFNGNEWIEEKKLTARDKEAEDRFGVTVAINGDRIVVGAFEDDVDGVEDAGSAYVFHWDGNEWEQEKKLTTKDKAVKDWFGTRVAVSGDRVAVGAPNATRDELERVGSAYVFHWNGNDWEEYELISDNRRQGDRWGTSVAIEGDVVVVGGRTSDPDNINGAGAAYLFRWDGNAWVETQKLSASDKSADAWFGSSVAIEGDRLLVGAERATVGAVNDAGKVYLFHWDDDTWIETNKFTASNKAEQDDFGRAVALSGNRVVVGAPADSGASRIGKAYVFTPNWELEGSSFIIENSVGIGTNTPSEKLEVDGTAKVKALAGINGLLLTDTLKRQQTLVASDRSVLPVNFGDSVSISDDRMIVGALESVYVFHWDGNAWIETQPKLTGEQEEAGFARSTSMSGNRAIVGAPTEMVDGMSVGTAYVFHWDGNAWIKTQPQLTADDEKQQSAGFGSSVAISGIRAIVGAPFEDVNGMVNAGSAYVFHWDWSENAWVKTQSQLTAGDEKQQSANFGRSIAISGNYAIVGTPNEDINGMSRAGSAYVFHWDGNTWSKKQRLTAEGDTQELAFFGNSVAISGDYVIVGAPSEDVNGVSNAGSAYIFHWDGSQWIKQQKLQASDQKSQTGYQFGHAVAIKKDCVIVSNRAPIDDAGALNMRGVYVFRWDGSWWIERQKIIPDENEIEISAGFGSSIAVSDDRVVINGYFEDPDAVGTPGAVHVFSATTWELKNSDLIIDKDLIVDGNVGIGTASPQTDLDVNGTIKTNTLNVTTSLVGNEIVGNQQIKDSAVSTNKILDGSVASTKLATNSVINEKILNATITGDKLAPGVIPSVPEASTSIKGVVEFATKTEMEGETSAKVPDANILKYHPASAKAWVNFDGRFPLVIKRSYNISSIVRRPGQANVHFNINFLNSMQNASYSVQLSSNNSTDKTSSNYGNQQVYNLQTSSFSVAATNDLSGGSHSLSAVMCVVVFGDLS